MSAGAKVRPAAEVAGAVWIASHEVGVAIIERYRAEVRAAALEEARLAACEFAQPCDGETIEPGRPVGWCSYCAVIRALAAQAKGGG